jgi:hypothetical protein
VFCHLQDGQNECSTYASDPDAIEFKLGFARCSNSFPQRRHLRTILSFAITCPP